jgi:hypothetical protein
MQEGAKGILAESLVGLRVEDELVPEIVGGLRGHGDVAATALEIRAKELLETKPDAVDFRTGEAGVMCPQALQQARGPVIGVDVVQPPAVAKEGRQKEQGDCSKQGGDDGQVEGIQ